MPTSKEFAREVEALSLTVTGYQEGRSGQNGLCDCIGLVMGAMTRLGRGSYPIRDTNYFERYQTNNLQPLSNADELRIGQIVYKATNDTSDLNDRYKPGGRYYIKDDMMDWYHIGVVTDLNPLEITHCTQDKYISGIKRDSSIKGWTHAGEVKGVDYETEISADRNEEETPMTTKTAYISVPAGTTTANLRAKPNKSAALIKRVPAGAVVTVHDEADGWAHITEPDGDIGYMMSEFLRVLELADENAPETAQDAQNTVEVIADSVTLTLPREAAAALFRALSEVAF